MTVNRRQVLLGAAALVVAGRITAASQASAHSLSSRPTDAGLPATRPWRPGPDEVQPTVKALATGLIEAIGGWSTGGGTPAAARTRAVRAGYDAALARSLDALLASEPVAAVQVRDAQYGGILTSSASVLVVMDQWLRQADGTVVPGGTTIDVRLSKVHGSWRVIDAFPAHPAAASTHLSRAARVALSDPRIRLPFAAHADVAAGGIHESVLKALTALAGDHVVDVSVLRSGHPLHVFGTSRLSDHPQGRAVDIWALDGRPIVVAGNHGLAAAAMRFGVAHGAYNVGGPVRLTGREYFSDDTHHDHVHLGFAT